MAPQGLSLRALVFLAALVCMRAELKLPSIFSDGCVLQTREEYGARSYVYGHGVVGETVTLEFLGGSHPSNFSAVVDATAFWIVTLNPLGESAFDFRVSGSVSTNVVSVKGCVGGDVYLCGGQR